MDQPKTPPEAIDREKDQDWLLTILVRLANQGSEGNQVTLLVGGIVVTGTMIGVRTYITSLGSGFAPMLEKLPASPEEWKADDTPIEFIHLKNAVLYLSADSSIPTVIDETVLWRGRLASVDGFILGTLSHSVD